jgi:hypothetical protein
MRALFALLALLGLGGIVVGILTILRSSSGPDGVPFRFEHTGGPGPLIAGIVMLATSLYLLSFWRRKE